MRIREYWPLLPWSCDHCEAHGEMACHPGWTCDTVQAELAQLHAMASEECAAKNGDGGIRTGIRRDPAQLEVLNADPR